MSQSHSTSSRRRPATVKDVASHAGVSASTVSNVLHDHPYVTADVRQRVHDAIAEIGYRPSAAGRQLRNGRSNTFALAIPDIRSPYFANLAHTVTHEARRRGYTILIDETDGDLEREREIATGYPSRGIEGVIFCPISISLDDLEALKSNVPTVLLGEYVNGGHFDHIAIDSLASAEEATEYLVAAGCTRIAFAGREPSRNSGPGNLRLTGVSRVLRDHGLTLPEENVLVTTSWTREEGERIAKLLAPRISEVDGLVCTADLLAVGALRGFSLAGVSVPEDISVISWDDSPEGRYCSPALTTISHGLDSIAALAVESLITRQADPSGPPRKHVVPHRLIIRESVHSLVEK